MQPSLKEYAEMSEDLKKGGFTDVQSEALVQLISKVFSTIENFFERVRREDKEDRARIEQENREYRERIQRENKEELERIRREDKEDRERIRREDREERSLFQTRLEAKIDAYHHQTLRFFITILSTLVLSIVGAMIVYVLQSID